MILAGVMITDIFGPKGLGILCLLLYWGDHTWPYIIRRQSLHKERKEARVGGALPRAEMDLYDETRRRAEGGQTQFNAPSAASVRVRPSVRPSPIE